MPATRQATYGAGDKVPLCARLGRRRRGDGPATALAGGESARPRLRALRSGYV
jgi:hypothetical protein